MAIPWLAVLKSVPWSTVVSNAPAVADGAKKLWGAVAGRSAAMDAATPPPPNAAAGTMAALQDRVAALESQAQDAHTQLLASSELIKALAEQNAQLVARLDLHRRVMRWFAMALVVAVALFALLVSLPAAAAPGGMKGRMGGGGPLDSHAARVLPADQKKVAISFKSTDGRVFPAGTRVVWPYACKPK